MASPFTKASLRELLRRHKWNITAAAEADGISKQRLTGIITRKGLAGECAKERQKRRMFGPRPAIDPGEIAKERDRLLDALARSSSRTKAAGALKLPRRTLYNLIDRHKITDAQIEQRRRALK